jgi:hypothetical protein
MEKRALLKNTTGVDLQQLVARYAGNASEARSSA